MARLVTTGFEIPNYPYPFVYGDSGVYSWSGGRINGYALSIVLSSPLGWEVGRYATIPGSPAEIFLRFAVYLSTVSDRFCVVGTPQTAALIAISGARQTPIVVTVSTEVTLALVGLIITLAGAVAFLAPAHAQDDPRGWLFVGDLWLSARIDPLPIVGYEYDMDAIGQGVGWLEGTAWVTDDWARIVLAAHNTGARTPEQQQRDDDLAAGEQLRALIDTEIAWHEVNDVTAQNAVQVLARMQVGWVYLLRLIRAGRI